MSTNYICISLDPAKAIPILRIVVVVVCFSQSAIIPAKMQLFGHSLP